MRIAGWHRINVWIDTEHPTSERAEQVYEVLFAIADGTVSDRYACAEDVTAAITHVVVDNTLMLSYRVPPEHPEVFQVIYIGDADVF
jgi:hypothetical protein